MKKMTSLLLVLLLCLSTGLALAEATPEATTAPQAETSAPKADAEVSQTDLTIDELSFTPIMVVIEDTPYEYGIPNDWTIVSLNEEELEWGYIGRWENSDRSIILELALEEEAASIEKRAENMLGWASFTDVAIVTINGRAFITCRQPADGLYTLFTNMETDDLPLMLRYDFKFAASEDGTIDEASTELALQIASTFTEMVYDE